MVDLDYPEDSCAGTDMNVVMAENGELIEVQGTAESGTYSRAELNAMLDLAEKAGGELFEHQARRWASVAERTSNATRRLPAGVLHRATARWRRREVRQSVRSYSTISGACSEKVAS